MNNKSYRVIWNEYLGSYVAVPEFASARGKSSGAVVAAMGGLVASFFALPAAAQVSVAAGNTQVYSGLNGVPIVDIATANAKGLSHNQYGKFNVDERGLVLNNNAIIAPVQSQLAGQIERNMNLNQAAKVILNEVVLQNRSALKGYMEVAGTRADVIVANPWGITCSGCGFINTDRVTMTTGLPQIAADGSLSGFKVNQGDIAVQGQGLNARQVNILDIVARSVVLDGQVNAHDLKILAGGQTYSYATRVTHALNLAQPSSVAYAIDSSLLGGAYAEKIDIIATEQGVGVRMLGDAAATADDFTLTSAGQIEMAGAISAAQQVQIVSTAQGADAIHSQAAHITAGQDLRLQASAGQIHLQDGALHASEDIVLQAQSLRDEATTDAQRFAAQAQRWEIAGAAHLSAAQIGAGSRMEIVAGSLSADTAGGTIYSGSNAAAADRSLAITTTQGQMQLGELALLSQDSVQLTSTRGGIELGPDGHVQAATHLSLKAATEMRNQGLMQAAGDVQVQALEATGSLRNSGQIQAYGDMELGQPEQLLQVDNSGQTIAAGHITVQGQQVRNTGLVQAGHGSSITAHSLVNEGAQAAWLLSTEAEGIDHITLSGDLTNTGRVQSAGDLQIVVEQSLRNAGSIELQPQTQHTLQVQARSIDNSGYLSSTGTATLTATSDAGVAIHNSGQVFSAQGSLSLHSAGGSISNAAGGKILATQTLDITTDAAQSQLTNAGVLQSQGAMTLGQAQQRWVVQNEGEHSSILSASSLALHAGHLVNAGTIQATREGHISAQTLDNQSTGLLQLATTADGQGLVTVTGDVVNAGTLQSAGALQLHAQDQQIRNSGHMVAAGADQHLQLHAGRLLNTGSIQSAGTTLVQADAARGTGLENQGEIYSVGTLAIDAEADVVNAGQMVTQAQLQMQAADIRNQGQVSARSGSTVDAENLSNQGVDSIWTTSTEATAQDRFQLSGDLHNAGTLQSAGALTVQALQGTITNQGTVYASDPGQSLALSATHLDNSGTIQGNGHTLLTATQTEGNSMTNSGTLYGGESLQLHSGSHIANSVDGQILSANTLELHTAAAQADLINAGLLQSLGQMRLGQEGHHWNLQNQGAHSDILSDDALLLTTGSFDNEGTIKARAGSITAHGDVHNAGTMRSATDLSLQAQGQQVRNEGSIIAAGQGAHLQLDAQQWLNQGAIQSAGSTTLTASLTNGTALDNQGVLHSVGPLSVKTVADVRNAGQMSTQDQLHLQAADIRNSGQVIAYQGSTITANTWSNEAADSLWTTSIDAAAQDRIQLQGDMHNAGTLQSAGGLTVETAHGTLDNQGVIFAASEHQSLALHAQQVSNSGTVQGNGLVQITATQNQGDSIMNSGTLYAGERLVLDSGSDIANSATGKMLSANTLEVQTAAAQADLINAGLLQSLGQMRLGQDEHRWNVRNQAAGSRILSGGALTLTAGNIDNAGTLKAKTSTINAYTLDNDEQALLQVTTIADGQGNIHISGDVNNAGVVQSVGGLTLHAQGHQIHNQGRIVVAGQGQSLELEADQLLNHGSIQSAGAATVLAQATSGTGLDNQGEMYSLGKLTVRTAADVTNQGQIVTEDGMDLTAANINNQGLVKAQKGSTVTAADVYNQGSSSVWTMSTDAAAQDRLQLSGDLRNEGVLQTAGGLQIDATQQRVTNTGTLMAAGKQQHLQINTQDLDNQGVIRAAGTAAVNQRGNASARIDNAGEFYSANTLQLHAGDGLVNSGDIMTDGRLEIHAGVIVNQDLLQSKQGSDIHGTTFSNGQGATLITSTAAGTQSTLHMQGDIVNAGLVQTAGALTISTEAHIHNDAKASVISQSSSAADLAFFAQALLNQGVIQSSANVDLQLLKGDSAQIAALINDSQAAISAAGTLKVDLHGSLTNQGLIEAQRGTSVTATGSFANGAVDHSDALFIVNGAGIENAEFQKIQAASITNEAAIHSGASLDLVTTDRTSLKNGANAGISALSNLSMTTGGDIENFGSLYAQGDLVLHTAADVVNNEGAEINSQSLLKVNAKDFGNYAAVDALNIDLDLSGNFFNGLRAIPEVIEDRSINLYQYKNTKDQNNGYTIIKQNDDLRCGLYCDGVTYYEKFYTYRESLSFDLPLVKPQIIAGNSIDIEYQSGAFENVGGLIAAPIVNVVSKAQGSFKNQDIVTYDNTYSVRAARYEHDPDVGSRWYSWYSPLSKNAFSQVRDGYPNGGAYPWKSIDGSKDWGVSTGTAKGFAMSYVNTFGKVLNFSYGAGIFAKSSNIEVGDFKNMGVTAQAPTIDKKTVDVTPKKPIEKDEQDKGSQLAEDSFSTSLNLKPAADAQPLGDGVQTKSVDPETGMPEDVKGIKDYEGVEEKSSGYQKDITVSAAQQLSAAEAIRQQPSISLGDWVLKLPSNPNGYFVPAKDPQSQYLVETNPRYAVGNVTVGSNYLAQRLGFNPDTNIKRLGDDNYEAYLVRQQLINETGRNLLKGYADEAAQIQHFLDQAATQATALNLVYGQPLTDAQVAGLTSDIVWMEVVNVGGVEVLAPRVYLSAASKAMITSGAVIEADDLSLSASAVTNTGATLVGSNSLDIDSEGDVTNTSGTIQGGQVKLVSREGSIVSQTDTQTYGDAMSQHTDIGKTAVIQATGSLSLDAGKDISVLGGDVMAGTDAVLKAKGAVTFDTVVDQTTTSSAGTLNSKLVNTTTSSERNIGSKLMVGGRLSITSGDDITLAGTQVSAGALDVDSQGDVQLLARQDTLTTHTTSTHSGAGVGGGVWGTETTTTDAFKSTSMGSSVNIAGDATIKSQGTTLLQGADMTVGGDATMRAKEGLKVMDAVNIDRTTTVTETTTYLKFTSDSEAGTKTSAKAQAGQLKAGASASASANASNESSMRLMETSTTTEVASKTTSVGSSLNIGGKLDAQTEGTMTVQGSSIASGEAMRLDAKNLEVLAGRNEEINTSETSRTSIGFYTESQAGAGGQAQAQANGRGLAANAQASANANAAADATLTAGAMQEYESSSERSVTHTSSSIQSGGDMVLSAQQDATFVGADVESGGNLTVSATNITNKAAQDIQETTSSSSSHLAGLYVGVGAEAHAKTDASVGVSTGMAFEKGEKAQEPAKTSAASGKNGSAASGTTAKAADDKKSSGGILDETGLKAEANASAGASAEATAGIRYQNKQSSETEGTVTQVTNSFKAKGDITRTATDTITDQGTQMEAGSNITQSARVIKDEAVSDTSYSSSSEQTHDARIGAYAGASAGAEASVAGKATLTGREMEDPEVEAGATAGLGFKASYSGSIQSESETETTAVTSRYKAGGNISSTSSEQTTLVGTELEAGTGVSLVAKSLDYQAAQDTKTSSSSEHEIDAQGTVRIIGKAGFDVSAGYEGEIGSESETTARAGSTKSGGDIRITTAGDANFTGTDFTSDGKTAVNAGGDINFNAAQSTTESMSHEIGVSLNVGSEKKSGAKSAGAEASYELEAGSSNTAKGSTMASKGGIELSSNKSVTLEGVDMQSDEDVTISARDRVTLKAAESSETNIGFGVSASVSKETEGKKEEPKKTDSNKTDSNKTDSNKTTADKTSSKKTASDKTSTESKSSTAQDKASASSGKATDKTAAQSTAPSTDKSSGTKDAGKDVKSSAASSAGAASTASSSAQEQPVQEEPQEREKETKGETGVGLDFYTSTQSTTTSIQSKGKVTIKAGTIVNQEARVEGEQGKDMQGQQVQKSTNDITFGFGVNAGVSASQKEKVVESPAAANSNAKPAASTVSK